MNPSGFVHQMITAKRSSNAFEEGEPTAEDSWFPGFGWALAYCCGCRAHLGETASLVWNISSDMQPSRTVITGWGFTCMPNDELTPAVREWRQRHIRTEVPQFTIWEALQAMGENPLNAMRDGSDDETTASWDSQDPGSEQDDQRSNGSDYDEGSEYDDGRTGDTPTVSPGDSDDGGEGKEDERSPGEEIEEESTQREAEPVDDPAAAAVPAPRSGLGAILELLARARSGLGGVGSSGGGAGPSPPAPPPSTPQPHSEAQASAASPAVEDSSTAPAMEASLPANQLLHFWGFRKDTVQLTSKRQQGRG